MKDAESPSSGSKIEKYITTAMIPATRGIRYCACREGTYLTIKKMATVRRGERDSNDCIQHDQEQKITGIKNRNHVLFYFGKRINGNFFVLCYTRDFSSLWGTLPRVVVFQKKSMINSTITLHTENTRSARGE